MADDGSHGSPLRPEDFLGGKHKQQHIVDEIIKSVVRRKGAPQGQTWEDVRQEVLIKLHSWLKTGRKVDNPIGLLTTLTENYLIDWHRHQTAGIRDFRKEVGFDDPDCGEALRLAGLEKDVRRSILIEELRSTLSGSDLEIFDQVLEDRTFTDIARERGVSKQAVAAQWGRLMKKLKKKLRPLV